MGCCLDWCFRVNVNRKKIFGGILVKSEFKCLIVIEILIKFFRGFSFGKFVNDF
jgi:hypothetical protein